MGYFLNDLKRRENATKGAEFLVRFLNKCERGLSAKYNSKKRKNEKKVTSSEFFVRAQTWKRLEK